MIYFTSDLHLGHRGIIEMQSRPFDDVEQMNFTLLNNFNSVVKQSDTVYILGDISHHLPVEKANELIAQMNGRKILIKGNHDKKYDPDLFEEICDFKQLSLDGVRFVLMHYPLLAWPKMRKGSICLHGHLHSHREENLRNKLDGIRRYDVGVDANDFKPISVNDILAYFEV